MAAAEQVMDSDLAAPIPLYIRFHARDFQIVGTTLDYFDYRQLVLARGEIFTIYGQCVIGTEVAMKLNLNIDDYMVSSPKTLFNIAGAYPLKMKITGVLAPTHNADNLAVFVDIQTALATVTRMQPVDTLTSHIPS